LIDAESAARQGDRSSSPRLECRDEKEPNEIDHSGVIVVFRCVIREIEHVEQVTDRR
jgi:hypothetical protein